MSFKSKQIHFNLIKEKFQLCGQDLNSREFVNIHGMCDLNKITLTDELQSFQTSLI